MRSSAKYLACVTDARIACQLSNRQGRAKEYAPVYPVGNVKPPVSAQRGDVVRCDGLCFARALEDEELWEDGDGLEEDGEGPKDLCDGVRVVEEDSEEECGGDEELDAEGIDGGVMCWPVRVAQRMCVIVESKITAARMQEGDVPEADLHKVEDVDAAAYEEEFHDKVVEGDPCVE
jgi:hypothetical protein